MRHLDLLPPQAFLFLFATVGFSLWLRHLIFPGQLLSFYGAWLDTFYHKPGIMKYLSKPLGACPVCFHTWTHLFVAGYVGAGFTQTLSIIGVTFVYAQIYERFIVTLSDNKVSPKDVPLLP